MVIRNFYIRNDQDKRLRKLPGKNSEHIRIALDVYLKKIEKSTNNVSKSKSKQIDKKGKKMLSVYFNE